MHFPILLMTGCGLAFLAVVLLNSYVVFITSCRVERTVNTVLFLNRAVADLIFIIFLPLRIFFQDLFWAHRLSSTVTSLHMFSSVFILTALSISHCILVAHPAWAQNDGTPRLAFWVVLGMWALSLGLSLRYSDHWDSLSPHRIWNNSQLDEGKMRDTMVIQFLIGFLIPLASILIPEFYIILAAKLKRNRLIQSTKPLKLLLGLILTFFICWLPYHIFHFLLISHIYHPYTWLTEAIFVSVLTYVSSLINPIIYLTVKDKLLRYWQCACNTQTGENSGLEPDELGQ